MEEREVHFRVAFSIVHVYNVFRVPCRVRTKSLKAQEMDELEDDVKEDDVGPLEGDDQEQRLAAEVLEENHGTYEITGEHISHEPPEATKVGEVVDEEDENEIVTYT